MTTAWQPLDPARWARVKQLFETLSELPEDQAQSRLISLESDATVIEEVRKLLSSLAGDQGSQVKHLLTQAPDWSAALLTQLSSQYASPYSPHDQANDAANVQTGERLGAWELQQKIGTGGMGDVYQARRADGRFQGLAAVKLLKVGRGGDDILKRFASEQQALARLNHPHIARLLDAGQSHAAHPYFVMELIEGKAIDQACQGLPLQARLDLFLQLCDAVAYAHGQLLVHRDLKPSNVLVNQQGQVKLLDFGIAKALDPLNGSPESAPQSAEQTQVGQRPYTPYFASPEQVRGEPVSTATDIYSLGVLLYVLLTGARPYGRQASTPIEAARSVLEETPTKPSSLSAEQVSDPDWIRTRKKLKGDLDNILLKALEKEPARRYSSVDALIADIRAHLSGHPVSAHAPSWMYLLKKFVVRNRLVVGLSSVAAMALIGGVGSALWQGHQAALARDTAQTHLQRIRTITRDLVLRYGDAITNLPGGLQIKEDLLKDLIQHLEELAAEANNDPAWLTELAGVYARLAEIDGNDTGASLNKGDEGRAFAERAVKLAQQVWSQQKHDAGFVGWYMQALQVQALGLRAANQPEESVKRMQQALSLLDEAILAAPSAQQRALKMNRAATLFRMGQFHDTQSVPSLNKPEQALDWFRQSEVLLDSLGEGKTDGDGADALQWHQIRAALFGARALTKARLNGIKDARGDAEKAVQERQIAAKLAPNNTAVMDGLITEAANLGVILLRQPDTSAALQATTIAWEAVAKLARENGAGNKWETDQPRVALHHGRALVWNQEYAAALPVVELALQGLAARAKAQANPNLDRMIAWQNLYKARALYGVGEKAQAIGIVQQSIRALSPLSEQPKARDALLNLGEAQVLMMQWEPVKQTQWRQQAITSYEKAHAILALAGDHEAQLKSLQELVGGKQP
ncbi:serine/threonine-protein kinase [Undibacterium fentianense]|uniref:Serine/threonine protein kinase n=1 Tax=Undibacterium fentianense TaxID=2828728 RepID=A0A941E196_9BURK|nr:serine/threonine-protein kinase [Undibacterium fentianense]MBR7800525.1 serine/threonine protein kinase [Undibacterium fentianense]